MTYSREAAITNVFIPLAENVLALFSIREIIYRREFAQKIERIREDNVKVCAALESLATKGKEWLQSMGYVRMGGVSSEGYFWILQWDRANGTPLSVRREDVESVLRAMNEPLCLSESNGQFLMFPNESGSSQEQLSSERVRSPVSAPRRGGEPNARRTRAVLAQIKRDREEIARQRREQQEMYVANVQKIMGGEDFIIDEWATGLSETHLSLFVNNKALLPGGADSAGVSFAAPRGATLVTPGIYSAARVIDPDIPTQPSLVLEVRQLIHFAGRIRNLAAHCDYLTVRRIRNGRCAWLCGDPRCAQGDREGLEEGVVFPQNPTRDFLEVHWHKRVGSTLYSCICHVNSCVSEVVHIGPEHVYQYTYEAVVPTGPTREDQKEGLKEARTEPRKVTGGVTVLLSIKYYKKQKVFTGNSASQLLCAPQSGRLGSTIDETETIMQNSDSATEQSSADNNEEAATNMIEINAVNRIVESCVYCGNPFKKLWV